MHLPTSVELLDRLPNVADAIAVAMMLCVGARKEEWRESRRKVMGGGWETDVER